MTKEKLAKQIKYLNLLLNRLSSAIPEKHSDHPKEFKQFLEREISIVKKSIEAAKLQDTK